MGESLDDMIALSRLRREETRERKRQNLVTANTAGWTQLSEYHFRRKLAGKGHVDWWPSTRKFAIIGCGSSGASARYRTGGGAKFLHCGTSNVGMGG